MQQITETVLLPWHNLIWESLLHRQTTNSLPHALLFSGGDGIGKKAFAHFFASYLLCMNPTPTGACGQCRSCHLQKAESHPDFMRVTPEENSQIIKIDQIREVVDFVNSTAMLSGYRIIIISPASAMNMYAANALLKTLEEPTENTLFILICEQSLRVPATISSRCQKIVFSKPATDDALLWLRSQVDENQLQALPLVLNLAFGAPLLARDYFKDDRLSKRQALYDGLVQLRLQQTDPLKFAALWDDKAVPTLLYFLATWSQDLLRFKLVGPDVELINSDYQKMMQKIIDKLTAENITHYCDWVQKAYASVLNLLNVNRQLLLKELFIRWVKLC